MSSNAFGKLFRPQDRRRAGQLYAVLFVASVLFALALFLLPMRPWWYVAALVFAAVLVPIAVGFGRLLTARAKSLD